ncbi:hypothetical protein HIM_12015 [Hirsutella minnesotensis 3608]|uniref:Integrase catalytic domain-containing protein n=1 Tax=Hirsutella minnesotensis 3608 TaxID=1043627 RepID=A0A0F7ZIH1_9HYPO|nr:hypothetical protein HIM_12015 [Hirsutella minnesotensis 3608]
MLMTQFEMKLMCLVTDGEKALLTKDYVETLEEAGIVLIISAPSTPWQNGHAERSGASHTEKARAMTIDANFPEELWPEIYRTAAYLLNLMPYRDSDGNWASPHERWWTWLKDNRTKYGHITNVQPPIQHLKVFGCVAYPMTIDALEHQKSKKALSPLAARAHIGYLVGYRASTQYVVWIPSIRTNKVMTTSNVQFDEDQAFDPKREENAEAFQVYAYDILRDLAAVDVGEEEIPEKLGLSSDPFFETPFFETPFFETSSLLTIGAEKSGGKDSTEIKVQERNGAKATHQGTPGPTYPTPPTSGTRDAPNIAPEPETPRVTQEEGDEQLGGEESGFSPQSSTPDDAPQDTIQLSLGTPIRDDSIDPGQDLGTNTPDTQSQRKKRDTSEGINQANILPGKRARRPRLTVNYVMAKASTHKLHIDEVPPAPRSHSQARESEHWLDWEKGMSKEIEAHKTNGTWQTVPKKQVQDLGYDLLPVKWVYDYKTDKHGFIKEFKARLVVRGNFEEDLGQDTYAATLKGRVFRLLTALGCAEDYETEQYDVKTAFLNTYLEEAVYCHGPTGYSPPGTCLKLIRGLYGLRIAPKLWYERLSGFFRAIGATRIEEDTCVWIREGVIVFSVDDIVMMYHKDFTKQWKVVHEALMKEFNIKYLGELRWFLGIEVIRDRPNKLLWLSQESSDRNGLV